MTVTIELTPEQERQLQAEALRRGQPLEVLAREAVERWLDVATSPPPLDAQTEAGDAERRQRMRHFLSAARANAAKTGGSPEELEAEAIAVTDEVRAARFAAAQAQRGVS